MVTGHLIKNNFFFFNVGCTNTVRKFHVHGQERQVVLELRTQKYMGMRLARKRNIGFVHIFDDKSSGTRPSIGNIKCAIVYSIIYLRKAVD